MKRVSAKGSALKSWSSSTDPVIINFDGMTGGLNKFFVVTLFSSFSHPTNYWYKLVNCGSLLLTRRKACTKRCLNRLALQYKRHSFALSCSALQRTEHFIDCTLFSCLSPALVCVWCVHSLWYVQSIRQLLIVCKFAFADQTLGCGRHWSALAATDAAKQSAVCRRLQPFVCLIGWD